MPYRGHVENGAIVLDEAMQLPDGAVVKIALAGAAPNADGSRPDSVEPGTGRFPLRGLAYRYDAPFEPAISDEDWTANV